MEKVSKNIKLNDLGTTFGGGMLAMAAVLATLEAVEDDDMISNTKTVEKYLRDAIVGHPGIVAVKGKGCLLGIEFDEPCGQAHAKLLERKIITGTSSDPNVLRLLPPLSVTNQEIGMLVEVIAA